MDWRLKAYGYKLLSALPFSDRLDRAIKGILASGERTGADLNLTPAIKMVHRLGQMAGFRCEGAHVMEIGCGWSPVPALLFYLLGAGEITLQDLNRFLSARRFADTSAQLADRLDRIASETGADPDELGRKIRLLSQARSMEDFLVRANMRYLAPSDASRLPLADGCLDLVYSTCVLEHVRKDDLAPILGETARVLAPGGLAYHIVDLSDHFSHSDPSIHRLHFLRFDQQTWEKRYNSRLLHQNRLREPDMVRLFEEAGFEILHLESQADPKEAEVLAASGLAPEFQGIPAQKAAVHLIHALLRKPESD